MRVATNAWVAPVVARADAAEGGNDKDDGKVGWYAKFDVGLA